MDNTEEMCITSTLACFQEKIKEAISLVGSMSTEDKLKAVQYWNVVSENLQDIVNSSADDISALASQLSERESLIARGSLKLCNSSHLPQYHRQILHYPSHFPCVSTSPSRSPLAHGVKVFQPNDAEACASSVFDIGHKQSEVNVIGTDLLDQYLTAPSDANAPTNDEQHSLSVMVDNCDTFNPNVGIESPLRGDDSIAPLQNATANNLQLGPDTNSSLSGSTMAVEKHLNSERREHVEDEDDPLPLPEVHLNADEGQVFGVDDLDISIPTACANDLPSNVELTSEEKNELGNLEDLEKYLTVAKNGKGVTVLNFFTKQTKNPEARDDDSHVYCCNVCKKMLPSIGTFYLHFSEHTKPFICRHCGESCSSRSERMAHMQKHSAPRKCKDCGREFTTFSNLTRHMRTHTGDRPFQCTTCGKLFREKKSLQTHERVHSGERPYQCTVCPSRFVQRGALTAHLELHSNIRRHLCDQCGNSFRQKAQLKMHKLRHEGKKDFQCEKCPMAFNVFNDLKRHRRSHLQDKPFKCDQCSKTFPRQQALSEHLNRHFGNKPYQCPLCPKSYADMSACHKHIKTHNRPKSKPKQMAKTAVTPSVVAGPAAPLPDVAGL